jgi:mono/diheme cytochrome c family protein
MKSGRTLGTVAVVLGVELLALAAGGLAFIYAGAYDVAATKPHLGITRWALDTTMDKSVRRRAAAIPVSETYNAPDPAAGYQRYAEMCLMCHGAPGVEPAEFARGLYPNAPDLSEAAGDWTPSELFWIVKNGVKMTGMPAFGPTHDEKTLWNVTAFAKRLPEMTPEQYVHGGKPSSPDRKPD